MSDLYMRDPDPEKVKAIKIEADRIAKIPHQENECDTECADDHKLRFLDFRYEGRFIEEPLINVMKEIGFTNIKFDDRTPDLQVYAAEKILQGDDPEDCMSCAKKEKDTGYFMLTAEKPL